MNRKARSLKAGLEYLSALQEESRRLLKQHGFVWDYSEDGYCFRSPRHVRPVVLDRLAKLALQRNRLLGGKLAPLDDYRHMYQCRPFRRSFRALDRWMNNGGGL